MTRLREVPWVEEIAIEVQVTQLRARPGVFNRLNLYRLQWLRPLLESRWPQLLARILTLAGFTFTILVGLVGSLVGSHNFAIIFVWIAWWTALKLAFIPLGGRSWCSICPIPLPGEWIQRGGLLETRQRRIGLNLHWPKRWKGSWIQSAGFLVIGAFSAVTLTAPNVTSWVLVGALILATVMSLVFEHRAFCSSVCPVGGFSGMYAQASPVEVRVIDKTICAQHEVKTCYQTCPWGLYPLAFRESSACGLCLECLRVCPHDNLALNLRPFGADLANQKTGVHLDMAFLALVMLGSVMTFSAVFTGPWGWLKSAAYDIGSLSWIGYVAGYLGLNLMLLPGIYLAVVWSSQKFSGASLSLKRAISTQAQALFPLGLMAWIAFTVSFAFPKLELILSVINDPFGWGWHWLGALSISQFSSVAGFSPFIQVALLIIGLFWSVRVSQKLTLGSTRPKTYTNFPVLGFILAFTIIMLWLLVG